MTKRDFNVKVGISILHTLSRFSIYTVLDPVITYPLLGTNIRQGACTTYTSEKKEKTELAYEF